MDAISVALLLTTLGFGGTTLWLARRARASRQTLMASEAALVAMRGELTTARAELKSLSGLLPMCAWCKKIRDDAGYWQQVEGYLSSAHRRAVQPCDVPGVFDRMQADMPDARWRI
jgi:hypothetical protein